MNIKQSAWTGMVPVDDTALYVTDTGGRGCPVVYLNGAYADQSHWRRVIADLGSDYRHITYDERARGKSKRSDSAQGLQGHRPGRPRDRRGPLRSGGPTSEAGLSSMTFSPTRSKASKAFSCTSSGSSSMSTRASFGVLANTSAPAFWLRPRDLAPLL
jgi:hypothetical protein